MTTLSFVAVDLTAARATDQARAYPHGTRVQVAEQPTIGFPGGRMFAGEVVTVVQDHGVSEVTGEHRVEVTDGAWAGIANARDLVRVP